MILYEHIPVVHIVSAAFFAVHSAAPVQPRHTWVVPSQIGVAVAAQSALVLHPTHMPVALQSAPPLSVHAVPIVAFV